jgi:hypothetical protein
MVFAYYLIVAGSLLALSGIVAFALTKNELHATARV